MRMNATTLLMKDRGWEHYHDEMKGLVEERVLNLDFKLGRDASRYPCHDLEHPKKMHSLNHFLKR